jgi:hypothetical protein
MLDFSAPGFDLAFQVSRIAFFLALLGALVSTLSEWRKQKQSFIMLIIYVDVSFTVADALNIFFLMIKFGLA